MSELSKEMVMRKEYDFSKGKRNPYIKYLKRPVTIRLEIETINHFKKMAAEVDIPYQKLINSFLRDCALSGARPSVKWTQPK
jgi:predicted DNA binding CopG/RHH family protein